MFDGLIDYLRQLSESVPLIPFAFLGGLAEEIVAPIPSPLVMMMVGGMINSQNKGMLMLVMVSFLAAIGKTIGSWLIYVVSDKAEDVVTTRLGKWLGVGEGDLEDIGEYFDNTWKDDVLLAILRAIPLIPGAPVAVVCGIIKLNMVTYLRSTLIGTFVRSLMFGFAGYFGMGYGSKFLEGVELLESAGKIILLLGMVVGVIGFYYLRERGGVDKWIKKQFGKRKK